MPTWATFVAVLLLLADNFNALVSISKDGNFQLATLPQIGGDGTRVLLAGLNRLFTRDLTRECRCEAASFLVAYVLGLPSFSLNPTTLEAIKLTDVEPIKESLMTDAGINRILVWLLASVAVENAQHRQLIVSDPRNAPALLRLLRERGVDVGEEEDDALRVRHALSQAELLLTRHGATLDALRERMESGAATVGNCVGLLEKQL